MDRTNYNGLTVSVTTNDVKGLYLKSAFTFSRTLGYNTGTDGTLVTPYNLHYDYGPLDYDITNRFVTSAVYRLPIPTSFGRVERSLLGGVGIVWNPDRRGRLPHHPDRLGRNA